MSTHLTSRFFKSNEQLANLNTVGILLGGSVLYKHNELNTLDAVNDWDGLILVERKVDIVNLLNKYRSKLCALFDISVEEYPNFRVPEINDTIRFESFDGVRFAGTSSQNIKKSFKILSVEHLVKIFAQYDRSGSINILSCKDGRVAGSPTLNKRYRRRIRQATRLDENLFILHDMDIFLSERCNRHGRWAVMFGVSTDLLMSGCWIYQDARKIGESISMSLFLKLCRLHPEPFLESDPSHIFAKHRDFQPKYKKQLNEKLRQFQSNMNNYLLCSSKLECDKECTANMDFFWGNIPETNEIIEKPTAIDFKTLDTVEKLFWKKTDNWREEVQPVPFVAQFYPRTQHPQKIDCDNGTIQFPWFPGKTLAMIRQELAVNQESNYEQENLILTIELQRAEDMLRAYCTSAKMLSEKDQYFPTIHRLFYERLVNNECLRNFYGNGISVPCEFSKTRYLTFEELLSKDLNVNGKQYGSLNEILEKAEKLLSPSSFINQLVIFGLGDAHSSNVLVSSGIQSNSIRDILYMNYEVAGYHSPLLDLANYFYYDVFFNILYADKVFSDNLFVQNIIQLSFPDQDILSIKVNISLSMLSKAILEIKRRYMLIPFLKFIEKTQEKLKMPDNWSSIFGHALFCCALLTRNFSGRPDVFFANLALGVTLTDLKILTYNVTS